MQELFAVLVPLAAVVGGLVWKRVVPRSAPGDRRLAVAAVLLVVWGAITLSNLSLQPVRFLGSEVIGYGPRYATLEGVADAVAVATFGLWLFARWSRRRSGADSPDPDPKLFQPGDIRAIVLQLLALAVVLVVAGVGMEILRHQGILHW
jgi:hypothetical protein